MFQGDLELLAADVPTLKIWVEFAQWGRNVWPIRSETSDFKQQFLDISDFGPKHSFGKGANVFLLV